MYVFFANALLLSIDALRDVAPNQNQPARMRSGGWRVRVWGCCAWRRGAGSKWEASEKASVTESSAGVRGVRSGAREAGRPGSKKKIRRGAERRKRIESQDIIRSPTTTRCLSERESMRKIYVSKVVSSLDLHNKQASQRKKCAAAEYSKVYGHEDISMIPSHSSRQSTNRTETVASRDMHVRRENEPQSQHARRTSRSSIVDAAASAPTRYDTRLPLSPSHLLSNTRCVQKVAGKGKQQGNPPATRRGLYRNDVASMIKKETRR